jgi:hypothetical protein
MINFSPPLADTRSTLFTLSLYLRSHSEDSGLAIMVCGALMQHHRLAKLRHACITGDLPTAKCVIAEGFWINAKDLVPLPNMSIDRL